jgi:hypothetical protein
LLEAHLSLILPEMRGARFHEIHRKMTIRNVLSLTFSLVIAAISTSASEAQTVQAFGDSITTCYNCANPQTDSYLSRTAVAEGWTPAINSGVSGSELTDAQIDNIRSVCGQSKEYLLLLGYNDMRYGGTDPVLLSNYTGTLYDALACLAIPAQDRINGSGGPVTYTATWSNTPVAGAYGKYTNASTATASFTVSGTAIYIASYIVDISAGYFSITVDGKSYGDISCSGMTQSGNGRTYTPQLTRIAGLSTGAHSVILTAHGGGSNSVFFDWAAGNSDAVNPNKAHIYFGNTLRMTSTGYATPGGSIWTKGSDAAVSLYNQANAKAAADLISDGWGITYVNVSSIYDPNTDVSSDNVHPTDPAGYTKIANAYISAIGNPPSPPLPATGFQPGTYTISDSAALLVDGGFYSSGDPTVRLWSLIPNNANQQWSFTAVSGGFTMNNVGTGLYSSLNNRGVMIEGPTTDVWTVATSNGGYTIKNNRTGKFLVDASAQDAAITSGPKAAVWSIH